MTERNIEGIENILFTPGMDTPAPRNKVQPKPKPAADNAGKIEPLMSITAAAAALNIPRRWIDNAINSGKLKFYSLGKRARKVRLSEINELIEKSKQGF